MNILIFNESFYPNIGGVERFIDTLAGYLHNIGVEVSVITNTKLDPSEEIDYPYGVYRCPANHIIKELISKSDIVHLNSFDPFIYFYSLIKRKNIVSTYHDLSPICPKSNKFKDGKPCIDNARPVLCYNCLKQSGLNSKFKKLLRPVVKSALSIVNSANVVLTRYQFDRLNLYNKNIISLGIDTEIFKPNKQNLYKNISTVVFAGRLIEEKGCDSLLRAIHLCINNGIEIKLQIIGPGPERNRLKLLASDLGIDNHVSFIPSIHDKELIKHIQQATVIVVPSIWDEPFGIIAVEAFACGIPVIASDTGGLGLIVKECGLVYKRGDHEELAQKITHLIENEGIRSNISEESRQIAVARYSSVKMGQSYYRLFYSLVNIKYNKNYFTHILSKILPFKFRRMIHVSMVNGGWPVRVKEGKEGINQTGHRGYVGLAKGFDTTGKLFFLYLKALGLSPSDILCDIGCGSLKVGKHLIDYLDKGNYLGLDKEEKLIELGINNELNKSCLEEKSPQFLVSSCFEFNKLSKIPTFALAISLFSHLNRSDIVLCLSNLANFIHSGSGTCKFYASFFETEKPVANYKDSHSHLGFYYTKQEMVSFGKESGWKCEYQEGWHTPSGQKLIKYTINND